MAPPRRVWRLSKTQYRNTIAVLFGGRASATRALPRLPAALEGLEAPLGESDGDAFTSPRAEEGIDEFDVRQGTRTSENVARQLVAQQKTAQGSCLAATSKVPPGTCAETLAASKGEILFRRPLTPDEVARTRGLLEANLGTLGSDDAFTLMFQSLLMSPHFLFRTELGSGPVQGGARRMDSYEVATALSHALLDGPADAELWAAATAGELTTAAQVHSQVLRLLATPSTRAPVVRFVRELFELERVQRVVKTTKGYERMALSTEADLLIKALLDESGRRDFLKTLLTTNQAFVSRKTSPSFGVPGSGTDVAARTTLPAQERAGLLTHPAFLAGFSGAEENHPVQRGRFVSERLLCLEIPELPIGTIPDLPPPGPGFPLRARLARHVEDPGCVACHRYMDPIGLAFEAYDHVGRVRTHDGDTPVDASGSLAGAGSGDGPFANAVELSQRLAGSDVVRRCFVRQAFRFWMGREEHATDRCSLDEVEARLTASGGDFVEMLAALFTSASSLQRGAP